jgi:hypothetical protein
VDDDFELTKDWLVQLAKKCGIADDKIDFGIRIQRIYVMLSFEIQFPYRPGLLKICCVCLVMTAAFSSKADLNNNFAEAIAFYLTRAVLTSTPVTSQLSNDERLGKYYSDLDAIIASAAPKVSAVLHRNEFGSASFGPAYELLWFANQHEGDAILNIWDQIIARPERMRDIVASLTVAHAMQFRISRETKDVKADVLGQREWDERKLIADAVAMFSRERTWVEVCCARMCPRLTAFHGFEVRGLW